MNAPIVTLNTEIPDTAAASGFPPTANRFFPKMVLFQMNHTIMTAATAQRMMVGNLPACGMNIFGIAESIAPKETPLVAYVTRPKMISMFAIVETNGCILNFAMKKPAIIAKVVVSKIHTNNARIAFPPTDILEKSKM